MVNSVNLLERNKTMAEERSEANIIRFYMPIPIDYTLVEYMVAEVIAGGFSHES